MGWTTSAHKRLLSRDVEDSLGLKDSGDYLRIPGDETVKRACHVDLAASSRPWLAIGSTAARGFTKYGVGLSVTPWCAGVRLGCGWIRGGKRVSSVR